MSFFFGNVFWGTLLILWGASLVLRTFGVNLPLAKIFLALVIILFGLKLLFGTSSRSFKRDGIGKKTFLRANRSGEYTMVFSGGYIDLKDIDQNAQDMEITVVFGSATVVLPTHLTYNIEPTTVFGQTVLPERSQVGFGSGAYSTGDKSSNAINIESTCVFGSIEYVFEEVSSPNPPSQEDSINDGGTF